MPITAYSREAAREVDLEQWLLLNQYSIKEDPLLKKMPAELRAKAARDIECSGCRAQGAVLVATGRDRGLGRKVSQGHFRFGTVGDGNPHDPFCDFYFDEKVPRDTDYLVNFASDRSALTRAVRDLVCRGVRSGYFGQADIRRMRLWFLDEKSANAMRLNVDPDLLRWCVEMDDAWTYDSLAFLPEHGQLPRFDWMQAARAEWCRRNAALFQTRPRRLHFRQETIQRALKLIELQENATVLDPTALRDKYQAVVRLSEFSALYIYHLAGTKPPTYWLLNGLKSAGRALLALSALLLFINNWNVAQASATFAGLTALPPAHDGTEGNVMGLNPFHDYQAWEVLHEAQQVATRRTDSRPVAEQIQQIKSELQSTYQEWLAKSRNR